MLEAITAMASVIGDPYLLMLIAVTTVLGIVIGVLPGLGATTGAALLLPFTLTMSPVNAIAVLATLYVSATFAGSITAILINTPGTSAAAATTFDGFPLAQRGEAGRALGIAVVSSTIGGIFSIIVLCLAAPLLARVATRASSGAARHSTMIEKIPPIVLETTAMPRARPASPRWASGKPSKVVAAAADVPGVLIRMAVIDPANVADT